MTSRKNVLLVLLVLLYSLLPSKSQGADNSYCYLGEMSPRLCYKHLAEYPTTRDKYEELKFYLNIIPTLGKFDFPECIECPNCHGIILKRDLSSLWDTCYICPVCKKIIKKQQWSFCAGPCVNSGYFLDCNQLYFPFFQHFLQYCTENPECQCYWPEKHGLAALINQSAIHLVAYLKERHPLLSAFSPYWDGKICDKHRSLATYCFFYSQHHSVCLDLARYVEHIGLEATSTVQGLNEIYRILESHSSVYLKLYSDCLSKHPHPKIYYERGMVHMHMGNSEEALHDMQALMELAQSDKYKYQNIITSEMFQQEGVAYAEFGMYDKAIEALNNAISRDPNNFEAYFQRASAYFEMGDFERSFDDYINFQKRDYFVPYNLPPNEFVDAFSQAAFNGASDAACDFVPSLCNTAYGLGECLWAFGKQPVESVQNLASASYDMVEHVIGYMKTVDRETLHQCADELVRLYDNYNRLSDREKGELIGYTVGRYGVDIFAGSASVKAFSSYKKLREANRICNFESMAISASNKESVVSRGLQQYAERCRFFERSKIHWDRQNKHIIGKHNYQEGKSIFEHKDAESLLRKYAGKGTPKRGVLGQPGYQEVVDFKEPIGVWVNKVESLPTTKGTIHYSKGGAHIVPEHPDAKLW